MESERGLNEVSVDDLLDTVVEVIDLRTGALLASRRFAQALEGGVGNQLWVHRRRGALGEVYIDLLRMELTR